MNNLSFHYFNEMKIFSDYISSKLIHKSKRLLGTWNTYHNKLISLDLAKESGLDILPTIIISSKDEYEKRILANDSEYISKNMCVNFVHYEDDVMMYTPAKKFDKDGLNEKLGDYFMPSLFQEYIKSKIEVKCFYLNKEVYCTSITNKSYSKENDIVDLKDYDGDDLTYQKFDLPT
jgi:hypothetical protein